VRSGGVRSAYPDRRRIAASRPPQRAVRARLWTWCTGCKDAVKETLHRALKESRAGLVGKLEGLSELDRRRPLTPTGTNLLGLVKHLAGIEYGYLGDSFGRPLQEPLPWFADGSVWDNADMWVTPEQSTEEILLLYREACEHRDRTVVELDVDTPGWVPWWPAERASTDLGTLLVRVLVDTARHAGQADVVRELIDGRAGDDRDRQGDAAWLVAYYARVARAAAAFEGR
jgi:Protein of unknown function (DUF664)